MRIASKIVFPRAVIGRGYGRGRPLLAAWMPGSVADRWCRFPGIALCRALIFALSPGMLALPKSAAAALWVLFSFSTVPAP